MPRRGQHLLEELRGRPDDLAGGSNAVADLGSLCSLKGLRATHCYMDGWAARHGSPDRKSGRQLANRAHRPSLSPETVRPGRITPRSGLGSTPADEHEHDTPARPRAATTRVPRPQAAA